MQPHRRMEAREWIYLITLAVLWSQVFLLTRIALGDMRPFTVVALRLGLGSLMLYCAVLCSGERMPLALRTWAVLPPRPCSPCCSHMSLRAMNG